MSVPHSAKILWLKPKKGQVSVGRYLLAEELREKGYDVQVFEINLKNVFVSLFQILRSKHDILVGVVRVGAYVGFLVGSLKKRPVVIDVTDPIYQINLPRFLLRVLKGIEEIIFKKADRVIFVTKNYMMEMIKKSVSGVKLNNGVSFDKFSNPKKETLSKAQEILRDFGVDLSKTNILYIGSLKESYNISLILEAAKNMEEYNFIFVGDGELKSVVKDASVNWKNIYYLGVYEHDMMPGFVHCADICLCLVNADQPLKLLEYGAASKPVITIYGELEERFTSKEVYFINPTLEDLFKAISELAESPKLMRKLGLNLKKKASKFQWEKIAQEYDKVLKSVLEMTK